MTESKTQNGGPQCLDQASSRLSPPEPPRPLPEGQTYTISDWRPSVEPFQQACPWRGGWQLVSTLSLYVGVWVLLYFAIAISWWLALPLIVLGAGLLVRIFIFFHDATHGSFFSSRVANDLVGGVTGVLALTPYRHWRGEHLIHHGGTGDLDRRGVGDVWTMTVQEYLESSRWKKIAYRVARNPFVLFVVAPFVLFVGLHRISRSGAPERERRSVRNTNIALFGMLCVMGSIFGFVPYLILQCSIMLGGGIGGIWLFYMQHQYEDAYWEHTENWDYTTAGLKGSSFLRLPRILQWFSGNIGFHHIHHLSPRIPNYHLERCHVSSPLFSSVTPMTFWSSFRSMNLRLWDEASKKLVGFRHLRALRQSSAAKIATANPQG